MKTLLFTILLAGATAAQAAPSATPATAANGSHLAQSQKPLSKAEARRLRKLRKQTGPEVYKGTVAEQSRIVTDAPGAEKEDGDGNTTPKKERKHKKD